MDAKKAIEALTPDRELEISGNPRRVAEFFAGLDAGINALKKQISPDCSKWIPVEERLPEPYTDVIVAVQEFGEKTAVLIDCLVEMESGKYGWSTYNGALERVTAWMPLPEPYQAE